MRIPFGAGTTPLLEDGAEAWDLGCSEMVGTGGNQPRRCKGAGASGSGQGGGDGRRRDRKLGDNWKVQMTGDIA